MIWITCFNWSILQVSNLWVKKNNNLQIRRNWVFTFFSCGLYTWWRLTNESEEIIFCFIRHCANVLQKGINPSPSSYGLNSREDWSLFPWGSNQSRKKINSKPAWRRMSSMCILPKTHHCCSGWSICSVLMTLMSLWDPHWHTNAKSFNLLYSWAVVCNGQGWENSIKPFQKGINFNMWRNLTYIFLYNYLPYKNR